MPDIGCSIGGWYRAGCEGLACLLLDGLFPDRPACGFYVCWQDCVDGACFVNQRPEDSFDSSVCGPRKEVWHELTKEVLAGWLVSINWSASSCVPNIVALPIVVSRSCPSGLASCPCQPTLSEGRTGRRNRKIQSRAEVLVRTSLV